jgi:hypothetical protein
MAFQTQDSPGAVRAWYRQEFSATQACRCGQGRFRDIEETWDGLVVSIGDAPAELFINPSPGKFLQNGYSGTLFQVAYTVSIERQWLLFGPTFVTVTRTFSGITDVGMRW